MRARVRARARVSVCDARLRAHLRTMQDEQAEVARLEAARLEAARLDEARREAELEARLEAARLEEARRGEARLEEARLEVARLKARLDSEEDSRECGICMERPKTHTLVPCGHCLCEVCSQDLMARRDPCPICRGPPDSCIRVFDV